MLNALTIDVEDYFQVHAFSNVIKYESWCNYECRVERNTDRILEILNSVCDHHSLKQQRRSTAAPQNISTAHLRASHKSNVNNNNPMNSSNPTNSSTQKVRATFFVLGWIAERYPALIQRIQKEGHEIACHGYAHQLVYNQSRDKFREDIKKAKAVLENITGTEVIGYRAPSYSITRKSQWAFETLIEEGFKYDSSIFPIRHDFYGMPEAPRFPFFISLNGNGSFEFSTLNLEKQQHRNTLVNSINSSNPGNLVASTLKRSPEPNVVSGRRAPSTSNILVEFPISTAKLFGQNLPISGGGYFRLFPYPLIKKGLKNINEREEKPFIFYMHPWEIDSDQPRINGLSSRSRFRHYINLDKTESKFRRLLADFQFSVVHDLIGKA